MLYAMMHLSLAYLVGWTVAAPALLHALLTKSDPKATLIWWNVLLALPGAGVALYVLFGINRPDMSGEVEPASLLVPTTADGFRILPGVEAAHAAMVAAIDAARSEVWLSTYIYRADRLGDDIGRSLAGAAARGVEVRLLLDGYGCSPWLGPRRFAAFARLARAGVAVRRYNSGRGLQAVLRFNLRNHRKICVVDERTLFVGSANIGWVRNRETHFRLDGALARACRRVVVEDWLACGPDEGVVDAGAGNYCGESIEGGSGPIAVTLVTSTPASGAEALRLVLLDLLVGAHRRIRIQTPYFLPDEGLLAALRAARLKGVEVEILLPARSNHRVLDWASRHQLRGLARAGCRVAFRADAFDHSKVVTVDGERALVGSSNWDARSLRLNLELDMRVEDAAATARLDRGLDAVRDASHVAFRPETAWVPRIRDALARLALPYL